MGPAAPGLAQNYAAPGEARIRLVWVRYFPSPTNDATPQPSEIVSQLRHRLSDCEVM